jgi:dipeptidyl aminopeptidase/acylaminoacyl peptidase
MIAYYWLTLSAKNNRCWQALTLYFRAQASEVGGLLTKSLLYSFTTISQSTMSNNSGGFMSASEKRTITVDDLYAFQLIADGRIAPDGRQVVYTVQRIDQKSEKKYTNLWLSPAAGGQTRQFTYGDQADTQPRWSPDGRQLAFISNRDDEKQAQIYLIAADGGEARQLTDLKGSFGAVEWSPDGRQLLVNFRKKDQETIEREADEQKKKLGVVSRRITRVFYKEDGAGYLPEERWHIWTVNSETGEATQLTDGRYDETNPCWSPDGRDILFVSNRSEDPDFNLDAGELYLIPAEGGDIRPIETDHDGQKFMPSYSPDGQWIAYLGRRLKGHWWQNNCIYLVPAGGGQARNLTVDHDLHVANATLGDVGGSPALMAPTWSYDGQTLYFQVSRHGNQPLLALNVSQANAQPETIVGDGVVGAFSLDTEQKRLAYIYANARQPGELFVRDLDSGEARQVSQANSKLLDSLSLSDIEEIRFKSQDGYEIQGWIMKPTGFDPDQKYPSVLQIHGGPQMQYGNFFMHEMYFLAANGYVVYYSNPRGSQGYGDDHSGAIYNNWGTVDFDDVMALADYAEQLPYVDAERMGVAGGSYGGYMTVTIIGRSQRFKAAVAMRVVSNFISMWGSSDFNWAWTRAFNDETPWENMENYWRQSPLQHIGGAKTPTLVIHSEQDMRCNQEQGEQVFVALKKLGVATELVLFPEESHGLSRSGRTDRRVARLNHILRWFDKYLK